MGDVKLVKSIYTGADVTSLGELAAADNAVIPGDASVLGLTLSLPVVTDAAKKLVSLAYTGATSLRKNLGLETTDKPTFAGVTSPGTIQITAQTAPASGAGVEFGYVTGLSIGEVLCYDRTGGVYKQLNFTGLSLKFNCGENSTLIMDSSNNSVFYGTLLAETTKRVACGGGSTGATVVPAGTVTLEINGTSYYLLRASAA